MKIGLFWVLFAIFLFFEGSVFKFPLILDLLVVMYVTKRESWIFTVAFFAGILLDVVFVRAFGLTSLFLLLSLFLVFLYEKKYEITTKEFVFFFLLFSGLVYFKLFDNQLVVFSSMFNSLFAVLLFLVVGRSRFPAQLV